MKTAHIKIGLAAALVITLVQPGSTQKQGPITGSTPYVQPTRAGWETMSVLTVDNTGANADDVVPRTGGGSFSMSGIPDGLGAFDNGDGTFTLLVNHEIGNTLGAVRSHGAIGAYVSKFVINKANLAVLSGDDLMKQIYGWNAATQQSNTTPSPFAFNRFCSADLPAPTAFFNAATGLGTTARIFMDGEEGGATGWQMGTVVTGPDAGKSYVLGKFNLSTNGSGLAGIGAWENALASPFAQDKTIVIGNNDGGTGIMTNALAVYVGTKQSTGSEVDKAGLTNGTLKFVSVTGNPLEIVNGTTRATSITSGTRFTLSGTSSTTFSRPEDGAWNPQNPRQYYFVTTDQLDQVSDGLGAQIGQTRLWRLTFDDITNPDAGGAIDLLIDGRTVLGEKVNMFDNIAVNGQSGHLIVQEDVGGAAHNGKMWEYDPVSDVLIKVAKHDPARFGDVGVPATAPFNNDEETSGVIDITSIMAGSALHRGNAGEAWYLSSDQAHYTTGITAAQVEGGQLFVLHQIAPVRSGDFDGDAKADITVFRPSNGTWFTLQSKTSTLAAAALGTGTDVPVPGVPVPGDYDGDGRTDVAVFRPSDGTWLIRQSSTAAVMSVLWGAGTDIPVPGDFDGDGRTDLGVYRPSTGMWAVLTSSSGYTMSVSYQWGLANDIPVPGDYDGDAKTDLAVYRPSSGTWFVRRSSTSYATSFSSQWGLSGDLPVAGDYDGDGAFDLAVWRPSTGTWYLRYSTSGFTTTASFQWGLSADVPVPGDYDGDGKIDLAVYRPSTGTWYISQSTTNYTTASMFQWGLAGDTPAANATVMNAITISRRTVAHLTRVADLDGDGRADMTVYRPSTGTWFNLKSSSNYTLSGTFQWGLDGDIPVSNDYDGDGKTDLAVYRPSSGTWLILQSNANFTTSGSFAWGLAGDVPVPGDYDGDGKADLGVYRPATGTWLVLTSSTGFTTSISFQWGLSGDVAVPGDFDGDGKTDVAVYRPSIGTWLILTSSSSFSASTSVAWGLSGDVAVPGDFDGDGKVDPAVYRPSTGTWLILTSSSSFTSSLPLQWGLSGDVAVPGDFDGDGKADPAVYRPSTGTWFVLKSGTNFTAATIVPWGLSSDIPILKRP